MRIIDEISLIEKLGDGGGGQGVIVLGLHVRSVIYNEFFVDIILILRELREKKCELRKITRYILLRRIVSEISEKE